MKYSYFASIRSGKCLIRNQFWYNNKSTAFLSQSYPLWGVVTQPLGKLYKLQWFWCDKDTKLNTHQHFLDVSDKLTDSHYDDMWFPRKDHRGYYYVHRNNWITHKNFYECADNITSKDLIVNPFNLLGYTGNLGSEKMLNAMLLQQPNFPTDPNIIVQLRSRCNIIPYKENIEDMAYSFFAGNGRPGNPQVVVDQLNMVRKFRSVIPKVLESYDIPYEMFSLDSGDYQQVFQLQRSLPRTASDNMFRIEWSQDVVSQVNDYMKNYG